MSSTAITPEGQPERNETPIRLPALTQAVPPDPKAAPTDVVWPTVPPELSALTLNKGVGQVVSNDDVSHRTATPRVVDKVSPTAGQYAKALLYSGGTWDCIGAIAFYCMNAPEAACLFAIVGIIGIRNEIRTCTRRVRAEALAALGITEEQQVKSGGWWERTLAKTQVTRLLHRTIMSPAINLYFAAASYAVAAFRVEDAGLAAASGLFSAGMIAAARNLENERGHWKGFITTSLGHVTNAVWGLLPKWTRAILQNPASTFGVGNAALGVSMAGGWENLFSGATVPTLFGCGALLSISVALYSALRPKSIAGLAALTATNLTTFLPGYALSGNSFMAAALLIWSWANRCFIRDIVEERKSGSLGQT